MSERKYVILQDTDVINIDFRDVLETSADTLRYSLDGTQTFVKFIGATPSFLDGKTQSTHSEILATLSGPDWTDPDPE